MADRELNGARDLAWHNRRVLAERLNWPEGMLETCEQLDREHPGWRTSWYPEDACFSATHTVRYLSFRYVRSQTVEGLVEKMIEADTRAADQRTEWELMKPRGWSILKTQ
jgi:hypothetical protein